MLNDDLSGLFWGDLFLKWVTFNKDEALGSKTANKNGNSISKQNKNNINGTEKIN